MEPQLGWGPQPRKSGAPKGGAPKGGAPKGGPRRVDPRRVGGPKPGKKWGPGPEGWAPEGWAPEGWGRKGGAPKGGLRRVGGPKFRAFSSLSRHRFTLSVSLWVSFLVEFWWCLKCRGPEMCTFGVLGLSCASPGGPVWWGRRGFTRQPESPNVHISGFPAFKTPPKFNEKTPRETQKERNGGGKGKKKSEILGGPAEGCPVEGSGGSTTTTPQQRQTQNKWGPRPALPSKVFGVFWGLGTTHDQQQQQHLNISPKTLKHQNWPLSVWPKSVKTLKD